MESHLATSRPGHSGRSSKDQLVHCSSAFKAGVTSKGRRETSLRAARTKIITSWPPVFRHSRSLDGPSFVDHWPPKMPPSCSAPECKESFGRVHGLGPEEVRIHASPGYQKLSALEAVQPINMSSKYLENKLRNKERIYENY